MGFEQRMGEFQEEETLLVERFSRREKGRGLLSSCLSNHETLDIVPDGVRMQWASRETLLRDMLLGLTHNLCRPGVRVGCFVGSRLPRRYHEASFTFATCTALAVTAVGRIENGHTLFFTMTPGQRAAGNRQTAPIAQEPKVREGHLPWRETERRWEGGMLAQGLKHRRCK
jgi:hypothetical protein